AWLFLYLCMFASILAILMPHNPNRIQLRNNFVIERFRFHKRRNPKWEIVYIIEAVADDVFLEPTTVAKILKTHKYEVHCPQTVKKAS
ncbi:MAG: hypothetical protein DI598_17245, partial [Pseudopedobacter saltans]